VIENQRVVDHPLIGRQPPAKPVSRRISDEAMRVQGAAIRHAGELLREIEPGKTGPKITGRRRPAIGRSAAAEEAGLSERQRKTAIAIAGIAAAEFDRLIEATPPPTIEAADREAVIRLRVVSRYRSVLPDIS
jgi:hypothetical protein